MLRIILIFIFSGCSPDIYDKIKNCIFEKADKRDFITLDINVKFEINNIKLVNNKVYLYVNDVMQNNIKNIQKIGNLRYPVKRILKKIFKNKRNQKVLVYRLPDVLKNVKFSRLIDDIISINNKKKVRYFKYIIDSESLLYDLILQVPWLNPFESVNCINRTKIKKKNNSLFIEFPYLYRNLLYLFEIDVKDLDFQNIFIDTVKRNIKFLNNEISDNFFKLFNLIELDDAFVSNFHKIYIEDSNCFFNKQFKDSPLIIKKEQKGFYFKNLAVESFYVYKYDFSDIKKSKKRNKLIKNVKYIDKKCFDELDLVFKFLNYLKNYNFNEEQVIFKLLYSHKMVKKIIRRIILKVGSGLNILFFQLCYNIDLINFSELIIFTEVAEGKNEIVRSLISENILKNNKLVERVVNIMIYLNNDISYMFKICLFLELEYMLKDNQSSNIYVIEILHKMDESYTLMTEKLKILGYKENPFKILELFSFIFEDKFMLQKITFQIWSEIFEELSCFTGVKMDVLNRDISFNFKQKSINQEDTIYFNKIRKEFEHILDSTEID